MHVSLPLALLLVVIMEKATAREKAMPNLLLLDVDAPTYCIRLCLGIVGISPQHQRGNLCVRLSAITRSRSRWKYFFMFVVMYAKGMW